MSQLLKEAMACFATGVTVTTAHHNGQDVGMTCNSFNTVSLEPAMVLWCIQKESRSRPAFVESGGFVINVLAQDQKDLALQFTRGEQAERFRHVPIVRTTTNRARLRDALAWFDCELVQAIPAGDHDILLGRVLSFDHRHGEGLVYARRTFGVHQPFTELVSA